MISILLSGCCWLQNKIKVIRSYPLKQNLILFSLGCYLLIFNMTGPPNVHFYYPQGLQKTNGMSAIGDIMSEVKHNVCVSAVFNTHQEGISSQTDFIAGENKNPTLISFVYKRFCCFSLL